jgi:YVTN family beta-propeller protein
MEINVMLRHAAAWITLLFTSIAPLLADDTRPSVEVAEKRFVLPNGWTVSPAGRQVALSDLPLNIVPLADNKHALVATNGYNKHELCLVDLVSQNVVDRQEVPESWFGLVLDAESSHIWWAGGGANVVHTFTLKEQKLTRTTPDAPKVSRADRALVKQHAFQSGITWDAKAQRLYALDIDAGTIRVLEAGATKQKAKIGGRPCDVVLARNRSQLYVSDWASGRVLIVNPEELRVVAKVPVGEHPNQLVLHPKDERLFVACASSNCVSVIDTKRGVVTETIMTALFPKAPEGSTPDALAVSPDGKTLFVANADNNCVAVIDISRADKSQVVGFIPTGWYPTAVAVTPDGKNLLVGVGKGNQTKPNPFYKSQDNGQALPGRRYPYIGTTLSGALSIVPIPEDKQLAAYTATVYRNCPYSDALLTGAPSSRKTAIPTKVGDPSPIKHVIYIIKENRTYDQVFGDIKEGDGEPSLVMFGEKVTPNHHKLAKEFVLLDHLYCNGHVSRDGHPWSTMAYHTDYIARDWALTYSRRQGIDDDEEGNLANAPSGYLWDACARAGLSYRSYGEYGARVSEPDGSSRMEGRVPGLVGHMCPAYGLAKSGRRIRDTENVEIFLKEFREFGEKNNLPRFIVMSLGEDHTTGTTPGTFTPQACVASNDLALGRLVEAVTRSKYWPQTAIFVIEDDAQNGPDHIDAHRTVGLVISPYARRHHIDSSHYATVSMIRSIELILGLPPLSQYDAAARPMFESFSDTPDLTPYTHEPAQVDLNVVNSKAAYGAARSSKMDFTDYDRVDDFELNEILWRAIKGKDAPVPPTVRRAIAYRPMTMGK